MLNPTQQAFAPPGDSPPNWAVPSNAPDHLYYESLPPGRRMEQHEQELAVRFVREYMLDFDEYHAVIRMGYRKEAAHNAMERFMTSALVQQLVSKEFSDLGLSTVEDIHRHRVLKGLYYITRDRMSPSSAKVAAYAQISKIVGLEAPAKTENVNQNNIREEVTYRIIDATAPSEEQAPADAD